jgi:hypothetical protein
MEVTEEMWKMLIKRFDKVDKKLDELNGLRLWKAKVMGALTVISVILIPILLTMVKSWLTK